MHKMKAGWLKWTSASVMLCSHKISLKLKRTIKPRMLNDAGCLAIREQHILQMSVANECGRNENAKMKE